MFFFFAQDLLEHTYITFATIIIMPIVFSKFQILEVEDIKGRKTKIIVIFVTSYLELRYWYNDI